MVEQFLERMVWPYPAIVLVVDSGCVRIAHPVTRQRFGILEGLRRVVQMPFEHGTDENAGPIAIAAFDHDCGFNFGHLKYFIINKFIIR